MEDVMEIEQPAADSYLARFADLMGYANARIIGRHDDLVTLDATLRRVEMKNSLLTAPAGAGKTALVEYWASVNVETAETYAIDLVIMGGEGQNKFAEHIKRLISEVIARAKLLERVGKEIVLFIDEAHLLGMPNYAQGLESLKPAMARGSIKVLAATTDEEYVTYIQPNIALEQRFQRFNLRELAPEHVREVLKQFWQRGLPSIPVNAYIIEKIIEYGDYFPADAQPRKSIKILDEMIGWHRATGAPIDIKLLNDRVRKTSGVDPAIEVDLDALRTHVHSRVKGQDYAFDALEASLQVAIAGLSDPTRPQGSFLFVGSTGVGKTEMAKALTEGIFGSERSMIRFDMSEFPLIDDMQGFRERLADAIRKQPFSVVLLDEIEKADKSAIDLLLQITDDGRLSDRYGRPVTFKNAYIIMTTNIGAHIFKESYRQGLDVLRDVNLVADSVSKATKPEFVGRIDAIVPFTPLTKAVRADIARSELTQFRDRLLADHEIVLTLPVRTQQYLTEEAVSRDTDAGGGRDVKRRIKRELYALVAACMNSTPNLRKIRIEAFGQLVMEDKTRSVSEGYLGVSEYFTSREDGFYNMFRGDVAAGIDARDVTAQRFTTDINGRIL